MSDPIALTIKWSGNDYNVELPMSSAVLQLKEKLAELTGVQVHRQKMLGLKLKGKT